MKKTYKGLEGYLWYGNITSPLETTEHLYEVLGATSTKKKLLLLIKTKAINLLNVVKNYN